jgi:hypothetical protein
MKISKAKALATARGRISRISPFGGGWVYQEFTPGVGTRETTPRPFEIARSNRRVAVFAAAAEIFAKARGIPPEECAEIHAAAERAAIEHPRRTFPEILDMVMFS